MTVAKSQVSTAANTDNLTSDLDKKRQENQNTVRFVSQSDSDTAEGRGLLTVPLGIVEAFPVWAAEVWAEFSPELNNRAGAVWQLAMTTKPKTLLICAAVALLAGFGVMAVAVLATLLTLLLKLAAAIFAGIAVWQWVRGGANKVNCTLNAVAMPVAMPSMQKTS